LYAARTSGKALVDLRRFVGPAADEDDPLLPEARLLVLGRLDALEDHRLVAHRPVDEAFRPGRAGELHGRDAASPAAMHRFSWSRLRWSTSPNALIPPTGVLLPVLHPEKAEAGRRRGPPPPFRSSR
jgi:hypothetical protein